MGEIAIPFAPLTIKSSRMRRCSAEVASLTSRKSTSKSSSSASAFSHPLRVKAQKSDAPLVTKASFVFFDGSGALVSFSFFEQPVNEMTEQRSDTINRLKYSFFILALLGKNCLIFCYIFL